MPRPIGVPEAAVAVAWAVDESVAHLVRGDPVFFLPSLFVHEDDGISRQKIIQGVAAETGHVTVTIDMLINILFDIVEIDRIAGPAPHFLHGKHDVAGLPAEAVALPHPMDAAGIRHSLNKTSRNRH